MTIVVGYIPNQYGEAALNAALGEARLRGSDLVVVNATRGDSLIDKKYLGAEGLASLKELLTRSGLEHDVRQAMGADVAEEILRVADEVGAELLVIGIRRRSPVGKMLMGSVAQQVLIDANCPVLAVKAD